MVILFIPLLLTQGISGQEIKIEHQRGFINSEFIYPLAERPTPQCHASTLAETQRGVLAAWFGGTEERDPDVGIWTALNDGVGWSTPVEVANGVQQEGRFPCWNPVLYQAPAGPLLLFYKVGPNPREWWGMLMTSTDAGQTWSEPMRLPDGIWGPIKNKPMQLSDGALLCGSSSESSGWQVYFQITRDLGKTWTSVGPVNEPALFHAIQPTLFLHVEKKDTTLIALSRTKQGCISEVRSTDMGLSWSKMRCTKLPNPDSGIDGVTLADGRHVLVYNHTKKGRTPLNVALSKNGKKWTTILRLEDRPGEYSYPAIIQSSDGLIHITYTWKRQTIKHVVLNPNDL